MLAMKRTGYPDDHSPQPDAGSRGQMGFKALHWARHEVASLGRAMESMKFVKEQAAAAKAIADKAAVQLTYLMESPCARGVDKEPGEKAQLPDENQISLPQMNFDTKLDTKLLTQLRVGGRQIGGPPTMPLGMSLPQLSGVASVGMEPAEKRAKIDVG
eukprot:Skav213905  [mRNA]  locus=scaffold1439:123358:127529:- [translate_table: standard]